MNQKIISLKLLIISCICVFASCISQKKISESIKEIQVNLVPAFVINGIDSKPLILKDGMKKYKVPAVSMAFFDNGKIQWTKSYGTISNNSTKLVNDHTLFQAASISKPVTALGVMKLAQEGEVVLNENINKYLKNWSLQNEDYKESEKATLHNLLSHTGGMNASWSDGYKLGSNLPSLLQILNGESPATSKRVLQETTAGSKWKYSNGGYVIIQKLIEDVSGDLFENFMQKEILTPIGMTSSSFSQNLSKPLKDNVAFGHDGEGQVVEGNWRIYPEQAAAGLWTTPSDLALFAISLQKAYTAESQKIVNKKTMHAMLKRQLGDWGLGIDISNRDNVLRFMHGGANEGYRCHLVAEANLGQGVVIMTNGVGGETLIQDLLRGFSKNYGWNIYKPREKNTIPISTTQKEKLIGKYFMVDNKQVIVEISNTEKGLKVMQTWNGQSYQIFAEKRLDFFRETDGVSIDFKENEEGKIIEFLAGGELLFKKS